MKLYRVTLRGMISKHDTSYVVAEDPTAAYDIVKNYLNEKGIGFRSERELKKIELMAETGDYPDCETQLYLQ